MVPGMNGGEVLHILCDLAALVREVVEDADFEVRSQNRAVEVSNAPSAKCRGRRRC